MLFIEKMENNLPQLAVNFHWTIATGDSDTSLGPKFLIASFFSLAFFVSFLSFLLFLFFAFLHFLIFTFTSPLTMFGSVLRQTARTLKVGNFWCILTSSWETKLSRARR
jgi:hypothetical protein